MAKEFEKKETDRLLSEFETLEEAEGLRRKIIWNMRPLPMTYIFSNKMVTGSYKVKIASEWGGRMNDEDFFKAMKLCEEYKETLLTGSNL